MKNMKKSKHAGRQSSAENESNCYYADDEDEFDKTNSEYRKATKTKDSLFTEDFNDLTSKSSLVS